MSAKIGLPSNAPFFRSAISLVIILSMVFIPACGVSEGMGGSSATDIGDCLSVQFFPYEKKGKWCLSGRVTNNCSATARVSLVVELYCSGNVYRGSAEEYLGDIAPGGSVTFDFCSGVDYDLVAKYKHSFKSFPIY